MPRGLPAAGENLQWQLSTIVLSRVILLLRREFLRPRISWACNRIAFSTRLRPDLLWLRLRLAATAIGKRDGAAVSGVFLAAGSKFAISISLAVSVILLTCPQVPDAASLQTTKTLGGNWHKIPCGGYLVADPAKICPRCSTERCARAGYKKTPLVITIIGIWGVRIPLCCLIGYVLKLDLVAIWWVLCLDQMIRMILSIIVMAPQTGIGGHRANAAP